MSIISYIKQAIEAIAGFNECVNFFQWLRSLQTHSNGAENQELKEDDVLKWRNSLQCLRDTLPTMRNFIDLAEWRSHEMCVAEFLPELKAAMYDAEDLLEYFRYYELKVEIEGSTSSSEPGTKIFHSEIHSNLEKLNHIKERLDNLCMQLDRMGLRQVTPRFDRSIRPETTSFSTEAKIFGRDDEIKKLISLLGVPANNRKDPSRPKRKKTAICSSASNQDCATLDNNEATTITSIPVLPIIGIGGVGKTTLAQTICSNPKVQRHFDMIVWICVSDDFDVKRLTKETIEQFSSKAPTKNNLNSLQADLADRLNKKRFLIVLDDMWDENEEAWEKFYAPFKHVIWGSMMLVTTRSQKVADIVRTTDPFPLGGLIAGEFQKFFKQCVFGCDSSSINPELEQIGEQILPKLKGSPLAAKTLGRLLGISLDPAHWNMILNSQLWELTQVGTDILPALRLSYMYLPFHLKRCFSFCAVYPKDYSFVKEDLAEIWMAEGFVVAQGNIPLQQTACNYFEELAHLSFFQKLRGKYVMHDLIHDMAQLVSNGDCFIIKEKKDLVRIPRNVRHLSVLKSRDFKCSDLENLCKQTKLRTLLCDMSLKGQDGDTVMKKWCTELSCSRVMVCASVSRFGLPDSISNMKSLRYLKISDTCAFDRLPASFCHLYNLEVLSARKCGIKVIPGGFHNLINLQKFESQVVKIDPGFLNDSNLITGNLYVCNLSEISKDQAAKFELMEISDLTLDWSKERKLSPGPQVHEGFKVLHPLTHIKFMCHKRYPGEHFSSRFNGSDDPTFFSSLTEIIIINCPRISSLEQFLHPAYMPAIKKMLIKDCTNLVSVPVERFGGLPSLEELEVCNCPKINSQHLLAPSLKKLSLKDSGNLGDDIDCSSLATFHLSAYHLASLTFNGEKLLQLTDLTIEGCPELYTLNGGRFNDSDDSTFLSSLIEITIINCPRLSSLEQFLQPAYMPAIKKMLIKDCTSLVSVPAERFGGLPSLEELEVCNCPMINSQHLLAPSLKKLSLQGFGNFGDDIDFSSLTTFHLSGYPLASLTFNGEKLPRLTDLTIQGCPELDTLTCGRFYGSDDSTVFSSLTEITIINCPRLSTLEQFLQPAYMPAIKKMLIKNCTSLVSVPVERFGGLPSLEELEVCNCPKINSQHLVAPSLKKLSLQDSGNLGDDIDSSSLTTFHLSAYYRASLTVNGEKLPWLTDLTIEDYPELDTLNGAWPILKSLSIIKCPRLKWENGIVLPSSLQNLYLKDCGYFCMRCLENLTSLKTLKMLWCTHTKYIPRDLWSSSLKSLQELSIEYYYDLVSIGGPGAIAHIPKVSIIYCPKLKEVQQPLKRGCL